MNNQPTGYIKGSPAQLAAQAKRERREIAAKAVGTVVGITTGIILGRKIGVLINNQYALKIELTYAYTLLGRINDTNPEIVEAAASSIASELRTLSTAINVPV